MWRRKEEGCKEQDVKYTGEEAGSIQGDHWLFCWILLGRLKIYAASGTGRELSPRPT